MLLASGIFVTTLIFIIWQPKGLKIGTTAIIGAIVALIFGVVSLSDSASLPFVFSNLTNIVTANYFDIEFVEYLINRTLFYFSWAFLALLLIGYFIGDTYDIPISVFALGGGLIFLLISTLFKSVKPIKIIKNAPWQVVWFSLGLYIVVYGLKNAGLIGFWQYSKFGLIVTPPILLVVLLTLI